MQQGTEILALVQLGISTLFEDVGSEVVILFLVSLCIGKQFFKQFHSLRHLFGKPFEGDVGAVAAR
ncbi:hypothetical protein Barb7_03250 [Bacteroidales bacterium Barb7]|nr:hypothetical protein Barb7_03250 [Bacteroidales bacterium Barb7]